MDNVGQTDNIFSATRYNEVVSTAKSSISRPSSMQLNGTINQPSPEPLTKSVDSSLDMVGNPHHPFPPYRSGSSFSRSTGKIVDTFEGASYRQPNNRSHISPAYSKRNIQDITPIRLGTNFDIPSSYVPDHHNTSSGQGALAPSPANAGPMQYKDDTYQTKNPHGIDKTTHQSEHGWVAPRSIYSPINFWFEDPSALFQTFDIIPNQDMTDAERLNAMTRVIILITAVMFIVKFPLWWMFLVIGIIAVIVLWYIIKGRDELYADHIRRQTEYLRRPRKSIIQPIQQSRAPGFTMDKTLSHESNLVQSVQTQPLKLISIP